MSYIAVTWKDNNSPRYDGKTHKIPSESLVDPPENLTIGTPVTVYWNHSKKKFWKGEIAPSKPMKTKPKQSNDTEKKGELIVQNYVALMYLASYNIICLHVLHTVSSKRKKTANKPPNPKRKTGGQGVKFLQGMYTIVLVFRNYLCTLCTLVCTQQWNHQIVILTLRVLMLITLVHRQITVSLFFFENCSCIVSIVQSCRWY